MNQDFFTKIAELFQFGSLAAFGGMIKFLKEHQDTEKKFSFLKFVVQLAIAFFVGCFLGDLLNGSDQFKDGYLMAAGYCANELLSQIENFMKNRLNWLKKG